MKTKEKKSLSWYKIDPPLNKNILHDKITEKNKSDQDYNIDRINKDSYLFTKKHNVKNKLGELNRKDSYFIFKDRKQNFENYKQARLINYTKMGPGLLSKNILHRIVFKILNNSKYIQWKNSLGTIECFKNIKHKNKTTFMQSDIIDFIPL